MSKSIRHFNDFYRGISSDIYKFCEALRFTPTSQQRQLFDAVMRAENNQGLRQIAVKSGQGPGKTTGSAVVGLFRTIRNYNALTIVTAPTKRQGCDVWIGEARRLLEMADPFLRKMINVTKTKIEVCERPDWGVKIVTATKVENAQGYHQSDMTVIAEEASGIPREIITQFKGTLSNPNALFIQIGNPNTRDCAFFDCFNSQRSEWECFTWDAEETARDYPHIVSPSRNESLEREFGRESDVYRVRVRGQFPHNDPNCVMSSEEVDAVTDRPMPEIMRLIGLGRYGKPVRQMGIDFARFGSDESVVFRRSGYAVLDWKYFTKQDPADVVDYAFRQQIENYWKDDETWYVADAGGMGQGIMHKFHRANKRVFEFHNGGSAVEAKQYANRITEAWFNFAKLVRAGNVALPKDNRLLQQLTTRQYHTNKHGQLILETKDEYTKRGFEDSPDRAEACVYSFYDHVVSMAHVSRGMGGRSVGVGRVG